MLSISLTVMSFMTKMLIPAPRNTGPRIEEGLKVNILYIFSFSWKGAPPVLQGAAINVFVMNDITVRDIDNI